VKENVRTDDREAEHAEEQRIGGKHHAHDERGGDQKRHSAGGEILFHQR
jgi:hypothetical protein